jgi:putative tricarboxylic transport membrane protein
MRKLQRAAPYVLLFGFSLFCLWSLSGITAGAADGQLGPAFWPRLILSAMALLCVYEALKRLAGAKDQFSGFIERQELAAERGEEVGSVSTLMAKTAEQEAEAANPLQMGKLWGGIALIALYAVGIEAIGFFVSSALFLSLFAAIGGFRHAVWNPVISLVGSFGFFFIFMKIAYISLPLGQGPFKALSLMLMHWIGVR